MSLIHKVLAVHRDLALGKGTVVQQRGLSSDDEQQIELAFIFRTIDEIKALDVVRYLRVQLHNEGATSEYWYDETSDDAPDDSTVLKPDSIPVEEDGRWLLVVNGGGVSTHDALTGVTANQHHNQQHEWNGADHANMPSTFPPATHDINSHSDVTINTPLNNDVLIYETSSAKWKNKVQSSGFVPAIFAGEGTEGYVPDPVSEAGKFLRDDGSWQATSSGAAIIGEVKAYFGALIDLPFGWYECNGSNSTPDLRGRALFGDGLNGITSGSTGGAMPAADDTGNDGSHGHSGTALTNGTHNHGASTNTAGSHDHAPVVVSNSDDNVIVASAGSGTNVASNAHKHTVTNPVEGGHEHIVTIDNDGSHSHTLSVGSASDHSHTIPAGTLPPLMGAYFIMYTGV